MALHLAKEGKPQSGKAGPPAAVGAETREWCAPRAACGQLVLPRADDGSRVLAGFGLLALRRLLGGLRSLVQVRSLQKA